MKKKHYTFKALQSGALAPSATGMDSDDMRNVQTFLSHAGYLKRERVPGELCQWTTGALRNFQSNYGIEASGKPDTATLRLMQRPRCGVPDVSPKDDPAGALAPFVLRGCKYGQTNLSFAFVNDTSDIPADRAREIVREAFRAWEDVSALEFSEVGVSDSPTFTVAWERHDHGDGSPFDEGGTIQSNVLAHGFFPPPCGGTFSGALHFDEFERWTDAAAAGSIRLLNVAIHEIGHLLGLSHSNEQSAIMFAFYDDNVDAVHQDDIDGVRALYGA